MRQQVHLYNSIKRKKELFESINDKRVGIYVCGPTVYGPAHVGHARSAITFDVIIRYLNCCGYNVKFIRNYTDVGHLEHDADDGDDKVAKQARNEHVDPMEIAQRYINSYRRDMQLLNILPPNIEPQASGYIQEQIAITEDIISKGFAYKRNGSVYFDVRKYHDEYGTYGILSGRNIDELQQETRRLNNQSEKNYFADFALWKVATPQHIMQWKSPWGMGFPGWHTECVALGYKYLGKLFDIHGGGIDLKFPHHECEIAQSQIAFGSNLAKYWIHNNLVNIRDQKMSKSLNNFITLQDLFDGTSTVLSRPFAPMVLRFLILQTHYRSTIDISETALKSAEIGYYKLINSLKILEEIQSCDDNKTSEQEINEIITNNIESCFESLNDDFNTAKCLASLFDISKILNDLANSKISIHDLGNNNMSLIKANYPFIIKEILGLDAHDLVRQKEYIDLIMKLYIQAKNDKNYNQVDFIRNNLRMMGIKICDYKNSSSWNYGEK